MKKKNLKNLTLRKTIISAYNSKQKVNGGGRPSRPTVQTLELSYCGPIGTIPPTCYSVDPCA
ncbi:hypothetical protein [Ascidiimonas sp. W6]|uniref:hypothetical protein n=1 Tax=Ascidiimonas meishanensis TaxID=3128903 RepID=UPI0030EF9038